MNAKTLIALLLTAAVVTPAVAARSASPRSGGGGARASAPRSGGGGARASAPRSGGGGPRASGPARPGGTAFRSAPGGHAPAGAPRTANGTARYGYGGSYGYGYGYGGYYPYYPYGSAWWYPWWGVGWYGGCWDCYWPTYTYAPYQMDDGGGYAGAGAARHNDPASVVTKVTPQSAVVILDGEEVGFAGDYNGRWDRLSVSPGKHAITFREKGYRSLTIEIDARPGAGYVLSDTLVAGEGEDTHTLPTVASAEPLPEQPAPMARPASTGRLRVHAEPGDAAVYLDGEYLGLAAELGRIHGALAVPTGTHRLEAARPGFASAARTIEVGDTDVAIVELRLESNP